MNRFYSNIQSSCTDSFGHFTVEEVVNALLNATSPIVGYEYLGLRQCIGRVLDEPILSRFDLPSHDNSAVDGYALALNDSSNSIFSIVGVSFAGKPFLGKVGAHQTVRIMTGAELPEGADCVVMQEHVETSSGSIRLLRPYRSGDNVRLRGENIRAGETVLKPGRYLTPPDIGLIASLGHAEIRVKRKLKVALFSTGDELCDLGDELHGVYDSNRYSLYAALDKIGVQTFDLGIIRDDPKSLKHALLKAADLADVVISSAGISVGDADYVKEVMAEIGELSFWKVALKPGRPVAFGKIGASDFFGLPGNPVAALVTFYLLLRPILEKRSGIVEKPVDARFKAMSLERLNKKPGRIEVQRGILELNSMGDWQVKTTGYQGSGVLRSMSLANCFILLEHQRSKVEAGESVTVLPFSMLM